MKTHQVIVGILEDTTFYFVEFKTGAFVPVEKFSEVNHGNIHHTIKRWDEMAIEGRRQMEKTGEGFIPYVPNFSMKQVKSLCEKWIVLDEIKEGS